MGGIEGMAARAGGSIATFLGKRLLRRMRLKALREWSTPTIPAAVARATIDELTDDEAVAVLSYLDSPDFEQLALQLVLLERWTDDMRQWCARSCGTACVTRPACRATASRASPIWCSTPS